MFMKIIVWNNEKNKRLKKERGVSFEEVLFHIEHFGILDVLQHHSKDKYRGQRILVVEINEYAYLVPFIENEDELFLKTIIPSRKATKKYLKGEKK